jgi:hypothetical protein
MKVPVIDSPVHVDLFAKGYDQFGQSPLTFQNEEINKKAQTMYEADVPSNFIQDGDTIVRLNMIDGYLQSDGFISGSEGWRIDSDGNVEFNNGLFRGTLSAASGTLGTITISDGGNIKMGKTSFIDTTSGFWIGDDSGTPKFVIGNATQYMSYDGEDLYIIGGTFRTGSTQYQIRVNGANGNLEFLDYETVKSYIHLDGANSMIISSSDNIYFSQTGVGMLAVLENGNFQLPSGGKIVIGGQEGKTSGTRKVITDIWYTSNNNLKCKEAYETFEGGVITGRSSESERTIHGF